MNMGFDVLAFKETLRSWVNFETPTGDEERLNAFSSLVFDALGKCGAKVEKLDLPGGPVLHAVCGNGEKRCVLMGHMDTVFPFGEAEKYDEENGRLYGAGVLDMKSGLLMLVNAFACVSENLPSDWRIEALVNSDEERGSAQSRETLLGVLSGADLVFSFEGNRENCVTVSRKGILTFEISAKGVAAHTSGGADKDNNAIYLISHAVNEIYDAAYPESVTVNIGVIDGGKATNIVADRAKMKGEIRAENECALLKAEEMIKNIASGRKFEYARLTLRPPMTANGKTMRVFRAISEIQPELIPRAAGGGGDAAFAYLTGAYVIDGMGAEGARAHTRREYVEEKSIERRLKLSIEAIEKCMTEFDSWT